MSDDLRCCYMCHRYRPAAKMDETGRRCEDRARVRPKARASQAVRERGYDQVIHELRYVFAAIAQGLQ